MHNIITSLITIFLSSLILLPAYAADRRPTTKEIATINQITTKIQQITDTDRLQQIETQLTKLQTQHPDSVILSPISKFVKNHRQRIARPYTQPSISCDGPCLGQYGYNFSTQAIEDYYSSIRAKNRDAALTASPEKTRQQLIDWYGNTTYINYFAPTFGAPIAPNNCQKITSCNFIVLHQEQTPNGYKTKLYDVTTSLSGGVMSTTSSQELPTDPIILIQINNDLRIVAYNYAFTALEKNGRILKILTSDTMLNHEKYNIQYTFVVNDILFYMRKAKKSYSPEGEGGDLIIYDINNDTMLFESTRPFHIDFDALYGNKITPTHHLICIDAKKLSVGYLPEPALHILDTKNKTVTQPIIDVPGYVLYTPTGICDKDNLPFFNQLIDQDVIKETVPVPGTLYQHEDGARHVRINYPTE